MNLPTQLLLISVCVYAHNEPLADVHLRRSSSGVYASDYNKEYEPVMYAAIPLHGPVPVLQVLSRKPLSRERTHAPSVHRPAYIRPYQDTGYAPTAHREYEYASYGYNEPHSVGVPYSYSSSYSHAHHGGGGVHNYYHHPTVVTTVAPQEEQVAILYARPNPHGGFSYRRTPVKTSHKRSPTTTTESPVVIRVHKYKVIRDR